VTRPLGDYGKYEVKFKNREEPKWVQQHEIPGEYQKEFRKLLSKFYADEKQKPLLYRQESQGF